MQELIERQAALRLCKDADWKDSEEFIAGYNYAMREMSESIEELPTIDAEPVRHGRWIPYFSDEAYNVTNVFVCSECNKSAGFIMTYHECEYALCPHCGTQMDGGTDNES